MYFCWSLGHHEERCSRSGSGKNVVPILGFCVVRVRAAWDCTSHGCFDRHPNLALSCVDHRELELCCGGSRIGVFLQRCSESPIGDVDNCARGSVLDLEQDRPFTVSVDRHRRLGDTGTKHGCNLVRVLGSSDLIDRSAMQFQFVATAAILLHRFDLQRGRLIVDRDLHQTANDRPRGEFTFGDSDG